MRLDQNRKNKGQGKVPRITYNGPDPDVNNVKGAVQIPKHRVSSSKRKQLLEVNSPYRRYEMDKTDGQTFNINQNVADSNSESGGLSEDQARSRARSIRALILNRAEVLLNQRKKRLEDSSGEDGDSEKSLEKDQTLIRRTVDYPTSSDDDKYVFVKTSVSPPESDIYTDLDVPLPPLPGSVGRISGKSLPSVTKVSVYKRFFVRQYNNVEVLNLSFEILLFKWESSCSLWLKSWFAEQ